jgi:hypothetical protein
MLHLFSTDFPRVGLKSVQGGIPTIEVQEFLVSPLLDDSAVIEIQDQI